MRIKHWLAALALMRLVCGQLEAAPYSLVDGLQNFDGSAGAWQLLQTNGFVVADPVFQHIYDPYVDSSVPIFITVDSAWHTYHLLLDSGLNQAQEAQAPRLAAFSRRLMTLAHDQSLIDGPDFAVLSSYAAMGLALQDEDFAASLPEGQKNIIDKLHSGLGSAEPGLGFPLACRLFKPFNRAARQWYASVVFRLSDPRETRLALCLAWLIHHDPELDATWRALSGLDDAILSPATDASVSTYLEALKEVTPSDLAAHFDRIRAALEKTVPEPGVNDQLLVAGDSSKGFRLFPPRRLPNWADAAESKPSLRNTVAGPLPDSIYGQSLRLWAPLQTPLPDSLPPAFRAASWSDLQLWSALAGWAELRHDGGPTLATNVTSPATTEKVTGVVAPYPKFFAGLAQVSRHAADLLKGAGSREIFDGQMRSFALICERLAALAQKQLDGVALTSDDAKWIQNYGIALQEFQPDSNASDTPEFPIISRLESDPSRNPASYAWVAQPQALYIILPSRGRLRLFWGAVLSYRSCVRADGELPALNDAPPAPDFTRSFRAEKTVADLLTDLTSENDSRGGGKDEQNALQQLDGRLTDADLPQLIRSLTAGDAQPPGVPSPIAGLIAKLNWKPYQTLLLQIMETNEECIQSVATILREQPDALDPAWLCANFDHQTPPVRSLYCWLLSKNNPAPATSAILCQAVRDPDADVRGSAIMAIQDLQLVNDQVTAALVRCATDTNDFLAGAAALALGKLDATNTGAILLTNLQARLAAPAPPPANAFAVRSPIARLTLFPEDPTALAARAALARRRGFPDAASRAPGASAIDALALALGDLNYQPAIEPLFGLMKTTYSESAAKSLDRLAPKRIQSQLLETACDKNKKPEDRDDALQLLLQTSPSKDAAQRLAPLLDETVEVRFDTPRRPMGRQLAWRLCDRAVQVIGHLLGKPPTRLVLLPFRPNEANPEQARQWLQEAAQN